MRPHRCYHGRTTRMVPRRSRLPRAARCASGEATTHDFPSLIARLRDSCKSSTSASTRIRCGGWSVPADRGAPLTGGMSALPRMVDEYVFDAIVELAPPPRSLALTGHDRQWLIQHTAAMSLSDREGLVATGRAADLRQHVECCRPARHGASVARALGCTTQVADLLVRGHRCLTAQHRR
jgi:hypothetical protein